MRRALQFLAAVVAVVGLVTWATRGAHPGWTKTQVEVKTLDEITGIEGITYEKQFVPGVDFLGAALIGAGGLAIASLFLSRKTKTKNQTPKA